MATNTYVALDKVTVSGSSVNSITFTSIPSTYTDLVIVASMTGTPNGLNPIIEFNGDTTPNTSTTWMKGNGSAASSSRTSSYGLLGYINSTQPCNLIINVQNYSNATTYKTSLFRWNTTADETGAGVVLWRATPAAITSVKIKSLSGTDNFAVGSTFSLYGIKAFGESTPKATGGAVTSDATYWYHTFTNTGNFVPNQSLTVDYAIVGGGAGARFGGGGAGGFRAFTGASLNATGYTVTVGAGGASAASGNATSFNSNSVSGGGYGSTGASNGISGGSGGGAGSVSGDPSATGGTGNAGSYSPVEGYAGGNAVATGSGTSGANAGGGGGAGGVGGNGTNSGGTSAGTGGTGGAGSYTYNSINISSWLTATGVGVNGYVSAGGAGGGAGAGLGANGATSSGNGAQGNNWGNSGTGVNGGSGVVIVRYAK